MKVLVYFTAFLSDNYQGGSGNFVNLQSLVEIPNPMAASSIVSHIQHEINEITKDRAVYSPDNKAIITKMEIV